MEDKRRQSTYLLKQCILTIFKLFLLFDQSVSLNVVSGEYNLHKNLFANYSKSIRPVKNWNDMLKVQVNIELNKIANVIENRQTINIYVRMEMIWTDVNLVWNPKDFNNIKSFVMPADKVWVPDLHLFNSANEDDRIYPINVEIYSNGTVQAYPVNSLYAHCDFDFKYFPYDYQTCDFMIGSMFDSSKLSVTVNTIADKARIFSNPEWLFIKLTESSTVHFNIPGEKSLGDIFELNWSVSKFSLTIKRSSTFYVNLFIWPLVFILLIAMSIFILPPTCVERASMGVLLLLSLVIMSLMLESYTPKSSSSVSLIGKLIGFNMFMVTWSTVISTLIISIDKDNFVFRNIPPWLKNIMVNFVAKLVCKYETVHSTLNGNQIRDEEIEVLDTNQIVQQQTRQNNQHNPQGNDASSTATNSLDLTQAQTLLVLINNQLAMLRMRVQEKDLKSKNKKDWYLIAVTLDRLCLLIYTAIMLLGLFIILI